MDERPRKGEVVLGVEDWDKEKILKAYNLKSKQLARSLAVESRLNVLIEMILWECGDIQSSQVLRLRIKDLIEITRKSINENES